MKAAIMQPYFLPYIGYFQLIAAADVFVIYDNIKYTKRGWINRNRLLQNGKDTIFSLSIRKDSDHLDIRDRELAFDFKRDKLLNQLKGAYATAPYFKEVYPLIEQIVRYEENNLFQFTYHSISRICEYLEIPTKFLISSEIDINHDLKSQEKVIALCSAIGAKVYINPIGGTELYSKHDFECRGLELKFIKSTPFEYKQFNNKFVPWLSIIDLMMFNSCKTVINFIHNNYELI